MERKNALDPEEQEEYILLENDCTNYYSKYGWTAGIRLIRKSKWLSGNGCGVRQAYFVPVNTTGTLLNELYSYSNTVWEDHVKPLHGQLELDL